MKDQQHESRPKNKAGFHRRAFLKGSGAATAATALSAGPGLVAAEEEGGVVRGVQNIKLNVNGKDQAVRVEPRMTLLEVLRYQLKLTGAKPINPGDGLGAATVLIGGKPASAGATLALDCRGKKIQTVESLGGKTPDPVVKAFVHNDGMQCGFCTPGFVVAVRAFLNRNPSATSHPG